MSRQHRVVPDEWSRKGSAVVLAKRQPLHVWGGIPGEPAWVEVTYSGPHEAHARFLEATPPHELRRTPPCEKFDQCGGCPLMHLNATGQRGARRWLVHRELEAAGMGELEVAKVVQSPDGLEDFRHVVKLVVGRSYNGKVRVGALGRASREVVPIPRCVVAAPVLRRAMSQVAHDVLDMHIEPYEPRSGHGTLRYVVLRASRSSQQVMVTLVAGRFDRALGELAERLATAVGEVAGIWLHVNDDPGNAILNRDEEGEVGLKRLGGGPHIVEEVHGIKARIGPADFFQTNPALAARLWRDVLEGLAVSDDTPFVDLYCGVGTLTLIAAQRTGLAIGVEELARAVEHGRASADEQALPAEFYAGRVEETLPQVKRRLGESRPVVCVNPARRGLEPGVIDALIELAPRRIAYVSCNPRALGRDLARFRELGFSIGPVRPYDMFPNTAHVETLVILTAPDADAPGQRAPQRRRVVR